MARTQTRIVGVDTTVLIWGQRKQGTQDELNRARWLIESLDADKAIIIVSTPVLAEYLTPAHPKDHASIVAGLGDRFTIVSFDAKAASFAAMLFKNSMETANRSYDNWRQVLRADCAVVAGAKSARAQEFYSNDPQCRKFAETIGMSAYGLPTMPNHMFDPSLKQPPRPDSG